jgi:hypothetical protein
MTHTFPQHNAKRFDAMTIEDPANPRSGSARAEIAEQ